MNTVKDGAENEKPAPFFYSLDVANGEKLGSTGQRINIGFRALPGRKIEFPPGGQTLDREPAGNSAGMMHTAPRSGAFKALYAPNHIHIPGRQHKPQKAPEREDTEQPAAGDSMVI